MCVCVCARAHVLVEARAIREGQYRQRGEAETTVLEFFGEVIDHW